MPLSDHRGYLKARIVVGGGRRVHKFAHRLVAAAFLGPLPSGMQVNHIDGNKHNNRVENLEYVTDAENKRHAARLGLMPTGERHGRAVLTDRVVLSIRDMSAAGVPQREIAARVGATQSTVWRAIHGKSWRHVP